MRTKKYVQTKIFNILQAFIILIIISLIFITFTINNGNCINEIPFESKSRGQTIISVDTKWTLTNSPYIITGNLLVENGATLTIEPGVEIKFDDFYYMQIEGKLIAEGTENNMIIFTSNKETPALRDWNRIKFMKNADYGSSFKYCKIEYVYTAISLDEIILDAAPDINNCIIKDNSWGGIEYYISGDSTVNNYKQISNNTIINTADGYGLEIHFYVDNANASLLVSNNIMKFNEGNVISCTAYAGKITLTNNILIKNDGPGINCHGDNVIIMNNLIAYNKGPGIVVVGAEGDTYLIEHNTILENSDSNDKDGGGINFEQHENNTNIFFRYNNIYDNKPYDVYNGRENDLIISNNWWGTTDSELINEHINDYYDNFNMGRIIYNPILTEPNPDAPDPSIYVEEPINSDDDEKNSTSGFEGIYLISILLIFILIVKLRKLNR